MKYATAPFLLLLSLFATIAHADSGDISRGQSKAGTCLGCHAINSAQPTPPTFPKIAGQHANYLFDQLQAYKNGVRQNPIMAGMVGSLSEQDMRDISAYYASLPAIASSAPADETLLRAGHKVFAGGDATNGVTACSACHGGNGDGNPVAGYPRIGGQHALYLQQQLTAYRNNTRYTTTDGNPHAQMMHSAIGTITDAQINAVAHYTEHLSTP